MNEIEFEHLTYSDINEARLGKLVQDLDDEYKPPISSLVDNLQTYTRKMINNAIVVIAKYNDEDVGFIATYCNDINERKAYITSLSVKKDYQLKHIGKKLVDIAISDSILNNMLIIELEVQKENISAIRFYEKYGFQKTSMTNKKSIIMQKSLISNDANSSF